jgi:hypothetical protein
LQEFVLLLNYEIGKVFEPYTQKREKTQIKSLESIHLNFVGGEKKENGFMVLHNFSRSLKKCLV